MVGGSNPPSATTLLADAVDRGARSLSVPDDATLLLAVSGGPDSMALLYGASRLVASGSRGWTLSVAHLDHALRPESAGDAAFVADSADSLGLHAHVRRSDVAALARETGRSLEEAGRAARYAFFEELASERNALIATAHTADDAAETVLINLLRGSGLSGARGIPARNGRVVRLLLGERRAELRRHLDAAGIPYRLDPSNDDPAFLRNRVRAELLPLMEELRPGAVEALARFARLSADDDELLDTVAAAELERRRRHDGSIDWREPPTRALGRRVLRLAMGEPAPSAERIEALLDAAEGPRGGLRVELGGGRVASVRERRITLD
ncbi:MAG TPA: tRNA lysidine(34) synthetase TilS [Candidatus Limnocylindria bacterium]